jgi:protein SCO1/2
MSRQVQIFVVAIVAALLAASAATGVVWLLRPARTHAVDGGGPVIRIEAPDDGSIIPGQSAEVLGDMKILPFNLIDQDGEAVDETVFDGHVTIVDFFFTRCPGPCPLMTSELRRIQQEFEGTGVRIVSFSVDAEHDDPAELRTYATANHADLATWTFVTGDAERIAALAIEGLGFALQKSEPSGAGGSDGPNILHPTHFVLVGPDRRVRAIAGIGNREHIDRLVAGARRLAGAEGG